MEIQYHGANAVRFTTKKSSLIVDVVSDISDNKVDFKKNNIILTTQEAYKPKNVSDEQFLIDSPGEFEFEDFSVKGVPAQPHTSSTGDKSATIYKVSVQDITVAVLGNIAPKLSEEQQEAINKVDIVIIPVGGNGYTLDPIDASGIVRELEPKLVIPVHCNEDGLDYSVLQLSVDEFTKELGAPVSEEVLDKLKIKTLPEQMTVQILKRA
jgi:L-ascorbate metabolism protein UlaG (beta-lactamase superfamily)